MAKPDKVALGDWVVARHSDLLSDRAPWEGHWEELSRYFLPRKNRVSQPSSDAPNTADNDRLFDSTPLQAAATLANGSLAYITPADGRWFVYESPVPGAADKAKQWYQAATEKAQLALALSNFYAAVHEVYYDDAVFGTYCLHVRPGRTAPLIFTSFRVGSYCLAENDEEEITTCFRILEVTPDQAVGYFGEENLSAELKKTHDRIRRTGKGGTTKVEIIHAMYRRPDDERDLAKTDGPNKPWASVYVERKTKHVCRNSGYDDKPFFAGRHLKSKDGVYGWAPSWLALPDARQLNFLAKQLDSLAEIKAFPRMLVPASHEGEIDLRSGGITYFDPGQPQAIPREWMTQGEYQIGLERENRKSENINRVMHVDMFQMFAQIDKQMTATEVAERASEKLAQFSPSFALKTTELLTPMLRTVFGLLLRSGKFTPPPIEVAIPDDHGQPALPVPEVTYVSRVALAIRAMQTVGWQRTMETNAVMAQVAPQIMDNFRWDRISRDVARNNGTPADWLADEKEVEGIREARAEAEREAQQKQEMLMAAEAVGKAGSVKQDSAVGKLLSQAG